MVHEVAHKSGFRWHMQLPAAVCQAACPVDMQYTGRSDLVGTWMDGQAWAPPQWHVWDERRNFF